MLMSTTMIMVLVLTLLLLLDASKSFAHVVVDNDDAGTKMLNVACHLADANDDVVDVVAFGRDACDAYEDMIY